MKIEELTKSGQIKKGDLIIITDDTGEMKEIRVPFICFENTEDEEIGIDKKKNRYFLLFRYLDKTSWIKDCKIIRLKDIQ